MECWNGGKLESQSDSRPYFPVFQHSILPIFQQKYKSPRTSFTVLPTNFVPRALRRNKFGRGEFLLE